MKILSKFLITLILSVAIPASSFAGKVAKLKNLNPQASLSSVTQVSQSNQPTLTKGLVGKLPGIRFTSTSSEFLNFNGVNLANSSYTIFIVEKRNSNKTNNYFFGTTGTTGSATGGLAIGYSTDTLLHWTQDSQTPIAIPVPAYSDAEETTLHVFVHDSAAGKKYYRNGVLVYEDAAKTTPVASNDNATIGRSGANYYNGTIGEIATYRRGLSETEVASLTKYFLNKWGTLTQAPEGQNCSPASLGYVIPVDGDWSNSGLAANGGTITMVCAGGRSIQGNYGPLTCNNNVYTGDTSGSCDFDTCTDAAADTNFPIANGTWGTVSGVAGTGGIVNATCPAGTLGTPQLTCNSGNLTSNVDANNRCRVPCNDATPTVSFPLYGSGTWAAISNMAHGATVAPSSCPNGTLGTPLLTCTDGILSSNLSNTNECKGLCPAHNYYSIMSGCIIGNQVANDAAGTCYNYSSCSGTLSNVCCPDGRWARRHTGGDPSISISYFQTAGSMGGSCPIGYSCLPHL